MPAKRTKKRSPELLEKIKEDIGQKIVDLPPDKQARLDALDETEKINLEKKKIEIATKRFDLDLRMGKYLLKEHVYKINAEIGANIKHQLYRLCDQLPPRLENSSSEKIGFRLTKEVDAICKLVSKFDEPLD